MKQKNLLARMARSALALTLICFACFAAARAQVASNPPYAIQQAVIAGGGGMSAGSAGNTFTIVGTIGQSVTDISVGLPYTIKSGFFTSSPAAPTAALVTVSGRVMSGKSGAANARVRLTDGAGAVRYATTDARGFYFFTDVAAGETYIFSATFKRFEFPPQVLYVTEDVSGLNFTGQ